MASTTVAHVKFGPQKTTKNRPLKGLKFDTQTEGYQVDVFFEKERTPEKMLGKEDEPFLYFPIGFRPIFRVELLNFGGVNVFFEHLKSINIFSGNSISSGTASPNCAGDLSWKLKSLLVQVKEVRGTMEPFQQENEFSSWWLNQPIWKICSSKWESSPSRGKDKKCLKPTPSCYCELTMCKQKLPKELWAQD